MPGLGNSAYFIAEDVLNRIRVILNDSEVAGGDVLTDAAPFTFTLLDSAFERVQIELSIVGVETFCTDAWLIGLPVTSTVDPEARMIVDDNGTRIHYPNGVGDIVFNAPQLPPDLVWPLKLWERQTATNQFAPPMKQPAGGLYPMSQQTFLVDWEWKNDGLRFRGSLQSQDVKIYYEKQLPKLVATTDPVPIRGCLNAAAYYGAKLFCASRGGAILAAFKQEADDEIFLLKTMSARRRQRKQTRRAPYSGRDRQRQSPI